MARLLCARSGRRISNSGFGVNCGFFKGYSMWLEWRFLLKSLLLPPTFQLGLILLGLLLSWRYRRLSRTLLLMGLAGLWLFSTPSVSSKLRLAVEQVPALTVEQLQKVEADAIVILTGGQSPYAVEFGQSSSLKEALIRERYGAFLHRQTGLPLLVTGGTLLAHWPRSLAHTMAFDLTSIFGVPVQWLEDRSRTTEENALFSFSLLAPLEKRRILLVTSALHMPRAKWLFERAGFSVVAAPTDFVVPPSGLLRAFLPQAYALEDSAQALHEVLGGWFYRRRL